VAGRKYQRAAVARPVESTHAAREMRQLAHRSAMRADDAEIAVRARAATKRDLAAVRRIARIEIHVGDTVIVDETFARAAVDRHQRDRHVGCVGSRRRRRQQMPRIGRPRKIIDRTVEAAVDEALGSAERRREKDLARIVGMARECDRCAVGRPHRKEFAAGRRIGQAHDARLRQRTLHDVRVVLGVADRIRDARTIRRDPREIFGAWIGRHDALLARMPAWFQFRAAELLAAQCERRADCDQDQCRNRGEDRSATFRQWRSDDGSGRSISRRRGAGSLRFETIHETCRRDEPIAEARQCFDKTRSVQIIAKCAAKILDGLRQHVRSRTRALPYFVEKLVATQCAAAGACELQQDRRGLRCQSRFARARQQAQRIDVDDMLADRKETHRFRSDAMGRVHAWGLTADQHTKPIVIKVGASGKFRKPTARLLDIR